MPPSNVPRSPNARADGGIRAMGNGGTKFDETVQEKPLVAFMYELKVNRDDRGVHGRSSLGQQSDLISQHECRARMDEAIGRC